jgi:iron uptake system component EfeO
MATTRRLPLVATTLVLVAATSVGLLAAMTAGDRHVADAETGAETGASPPVIIDVSLADCGSGWAPGPAGPQEITVHNADLHAGEVRVVGVDPQNVARVFAELEPFGPDTTVTLHVRLAAGQKLTGVG